MTSFYSSSPPSHRQPLPFTSQPYTNSATTRFTPPSTPLSIPSSSSPASPSPTSTSKKSAHPLRKKKIARTSLAPSLPSEEYLTLSSLPSTPLPSDSTTEPPLIILDLNHTLLHRTSAAMSHQPILRPYLATFLAYLLKTATDGEPSVGKGKGKKKEESLVEEKSLKSQKKRWNVVVYSSARRDNVLKMLRALDLAPPLPPTPTLEELSGTFSGLSLDTGEEEGPLDFIFTRENMGLSPEEYGKNVETVKDLDQVWKQPELGEGKWDAKRTVVLDDEEEKIKLHPFNHLPITPFFGNPSPPSPSPPSTKSKKPSFETSPSPTGSRRSSSSLSTQPSFPSALTLDFNSLPSPLSPPVSPRTIIPSDPPPFPPSTSTPPKSTKPKRVSFSPSTTSLRSSASPQKSQQSEDEKKDKALLRSIYLLEVLKKESNIASFVRSGGLGELEELGEEELEKRGRRVCEELGVELREEWEGGWRSC